MARRVVQTFLDVTVDSRVWTGRNDESPHRSWRYHRAVRSVGAPSTGQVPRALWMRRDNVTRLHPRRTCSAHPSATLGNMSDSIHLRPVSEGQLSRLLELLTGDPSDTGEFQWFGFRMALAKE